jgi:predicted transcriptional regulator
MQDTKEIYYGMFTDAGNQAVHAIVEQARSTDRAWLEVYQELVRLADVEVFAEATDTMVREIVYDTLGFNSDFYV